MINDGALVELAEYCVRTCHVLKNVNQGRGVGLNGPNKEAIENLGRYVNLTHSSLSMIMSNLRTIRNIESMVIERRHRAHELREHHSDATKGRLIAWRTELLETLRILDVRDRLFTMPTTLEPPQGDVMLDNVHEAGEIKHQAQGSIDAETPTSASMVVCCFCPCAPLPTDHLLGIDWVSLFYRQNVRGY